MGQKIKVAITLTVEVDADGWELDYGVSGAAEIRKDVKAYVRNVVQSSSENLEILPSK